MIMRNAGMRYGEVSIRSWTRPSEYRCVGEYHAAFGVRPIVLDRQRGVSSSEIARLRRRRVRSKRGAARPERFGVRVQSTVVGETAAILSRAGQHVVRGLQMVPAISTSSWGEPRLLLYFAIGAQALEVDGV